MTHLSFDDREIIEFALKENKNFTQIAKLISKHRTTVANEILKHRIVNKPNVYGRTLVYCSLEKDCSDFHGVGCTKKCKHFKPATCIKLETPPYVCNGCRKRSGCPLQKFYYRAKEANNEYHSYLCESRQGIRLSKKEINIIEKTIAPLILNNKQSVNQVYINHPDILYFSKTTFYNLINLGVFSFKNIDLPRKVKYKENRNGKRRTREESLVRVNRTYKDYLHYLDEHKNENVSIVQMDTVEGVKGEKCFLTLLLVQYNLMFIYIIDTKTMKSVSNIFKWIKKTIGIDIFKKVFQVVITDNGSEFFDPLSIEIDEHTGEKVSNVFYCDPSASYQKGAIEKNHEYIRYILPKGTSFNNLTQEDCNILMSHINSIPRKILKDSTPYKETLHFLKEETLNKLGVIEIAPDDVSLSQDLLKKKDRNL